jgi:hypothetical protein
MSYEHGWIDRQTVIESIKVDVEKPSSVTTSWWVDVEVQNIYFNNPGWSNTRTMRVDKSNLSNNTINLYQVFEGQGGNAAPAPDYWIEIGTFYFVFTYKSYENNTTSQSRSYCNYTHNPDGEGGGMADPRLPGIARDLNNLNENTWLKTDSKSWSDNFPYLTYYSKSTSWNTLTTLTNTYEVPAQTTSSWVEPRQVSSLV